jgi:hypothetical protein
MATVNFLYRSTREDANLVARLLFTHNDKNEVLGANTKFLINGKYWTANHVPNKKTKKIAGTKDPVVLNKRVEVAAELKNINDHILKAFNSVNPDHVNKEWLQTQIDNYYNPPIEVEVEPLPKELLMYFDYFMEQKRTEISKGTYKKYNVTKSLLKRYQKSVVQTILIENINEKFKKDFERYCITQNYAPNTISKDLRTIKTVCNHAKNNGLLTSHQLDSIKTPLHKIEKIYLTFEDIKSIENIDPRRLNDNYENAKDWLIISCYTGQRISDFMRFDKKMIRHEKNRQGDLKPFIEFTQVKTDKVMTIALHPKVIEILNKRNGNFPKVISDPKYNLFIKQVCRIAGLTEIIKGSVLVDLNKEDEPETKKKTIKKVTVKQYRKEVGFYKKWELICSHIGRKSFASNFYGTIPTTYLINVTGHSTEQMFLSYIGKSNKDLAMGITSYF